MSAYRAPLQLDSVTKRYGDGSGGRSPAVDRVDLTVRAGRVYGLLGPSGAGKTTALRLLAGLAEPTAGRVRVAGASTADRDALLGRIGYLPPEPSLPGGSTGRELLATVAALRDVPEDEAERRIGRLGRRLGVADALDGRLETLPPGSRRAIAVAAAVVHEPRVLLLDEPGRDLDHRTRTAVDEVVADLAADGSTAVVASRRLGRVEDVADRLGVLHEGRLVAEGSPDALRAMAAAGGSDPVPPAGPAPPVDAGVAIDAVVERVVVEPPGEDDDPDPHGGADDRPTEDRRVGRPAGQPDGSDDTTAGGRDEDRPRDRRRPSPRA